VWVVCREQGMWTGSAPGWCLEGSGFCWWPVDNVVFSETHIISPRLVLSLNVGFGSGLRVFVGSADALEACEWFLGRIFVLFWYTYVG
jgi:hypothetical protein